MRLSDSPEQVAAASAEQEWAPFAQFALENLFDVSPDANFVAGSEGVIRGADSRAAQLLGHTQADLPGQPTENLFPERFSGRHPSHRENFQAHPRVRQMAHAVDTVAGH